MNYHKEPNTGCLTAIIIFTFSLPLACLITAAVLGLGSL